MHKITQIYQSLHDYISFTNSLKELTNQLLTLFVCCLFVFLALQPTVVVFSQAGSGL